LLAEIVADQTRHHLEEMGLLVRRQRRVEQRLLHAEQPAELFGALGERRRQRAQARGGEHFDQLGHADRRCQRVQAVEDVQLGHAFALRQREVDRGGAGRVVRDRDDGLQAERVDDGAEVAELLREIVDGAGGLVRLAEAEEVEADDAPARAREVGHELVVNVQVVGEAVHQHEGGTGARVVAHVQLAVRAGDAVFDVPRRGDVHGVPSR
jgi:hypothetical protein